MAATARAIDLSDVKEGGNFRPRRKPEGDYRAKIVKADDHQPKDKSKAAGWVLTIMVEGDGRSTYPYYLSPEKNQVWKVAGICRAAGLNVKTARIRFDPNKLVNKTIGIALVDEEYNDRLKSVIDDVFLASEVGANADEDPEIVDEDEDEVYDDETPEDDEPEEEEEPAPAPKRTVRRKPAPEPEPEPEDEEEYEDEDEEPEPEPAPKTRRVVRKKPTPPPVEDDEELDLDDLDD